MSAGEWQYEVDEPLISIGVLARKVGLSVSAIRKYENEGLVLADRTASGHRLFSQEDIRRVRNIHRMIQDSGLNIERIRRIRALLPCWDLLPCSEEARANCPAYKKEAARPCWMVGGLACAARGDACRRCAVYRFGSLCTQDIGRLQCGASDVWDACGAMRELWRRLGSPNG